MSGEGQRRDDGKWTVTWGAGSLRGRLRQRGQGHGWACHVPPRIPKGHGESRFPRWRLAAIPGHPQRRLETPDRPGGDGGRPATGRRPVTVPSAPAGSSPRPPGLGMGQGRDRRDGRAALVGDAPGCLASSVGAPAAPPPLMPHRQPVAGVLAGDGLGRHEVGFGTGTLAGTPV